MSRHNFLMVEFFAEYLMIFYQCSQLYPIDLFTYELNVYNVFFD